MWCGQSGISQPKMIRALVLLCIASIISVARCHKIHEHMTPEEMMLVFQTGHESVPAYEVVPVLHTIHKRSAEIVEPAEVHLKAFGKDFNLSLKPTKGLFPSNKHVPMWTVARNDSNPDGLYYEQVEEASVDIGDIYQDTATMASILLHQDQTGKVVVINRCGENRESDLLPTETVSHRLKVLCYTVNKVQQVRQRQRHWPSQRSERERQQRVAHHVKDGNIGSELVIRPLPERVLKEIVEKTEGLHQPSLWPNMTTRTKRSLRQTNHHVVFRRSARPMDDEYSDFMLMEPDHLAKRFRSKRSPGTRSKREAPYVIYPEILCIVDYDGYRLHGGDNVQIKRYFVSFWNGVDLRYKLLKGPKIRISIAGIIISRGRDATPYLERNRVGRDAIDSAAALTDMGKYLFRERRLPVYDIAVAVTKLDMCRRQYANDVCNRGTAGFAYVGGACVVNKRLEKVNSVAIIEDTGGFSGIIVAAHEVGHLLGAVHDGSPPPSYLGGPGAEKCRWEDGYIMSDLRHTEKGFKWSHCSVSSFHHFLNGDTATCLYNAPHEDEALPRVLPGKLLSLDAQCRKDRGTSACFKDDRVCAQLFCFDAGSGYCVAYRPAAEGSPCGDGQYCLSGKCVAEHENIIPDYTQNIPTYVRRDSIYSAATQNRPTFGQYNSTDYSVTRYAPHRSPWASTRQTTPQTTYKYSSPYRNSAPYTYTPTTRRHFYTYSTQATPISIKTTDYNDINDYDKVKNLYSPHASAAISTTTTKKANNYYNYLFNVYTSPSTVSTVVSSKLYGYTNNALHQKITPFKYKSTSTTASFASSITGYGRQSTTVRETRDDECTDLASDCAELIDRLRTWLCHLQSVRSRCCASLKGVCSD